LTKLRTTPSFEDKASAGTAAGAALLPPAAQLLFLALRVEEEELAIENG
jgi:hypothetical protein